MISPIKIWREHKKLSDSIGKKGIILFWTFERNLSYPIVLVKFENGKNSLIQMVDYNEKQLKSGQEVITVLRKLSKTSPDEVIRYGIKVRPI